MYKIWTKIDEKLCRFISLYKSLSQTQKEFDKFTDKPELNLDLAVQNNPYLVVVLGDFNAKSKNCMVVIKPVLKEM